MAAERALVDAQGDAVLEHAVADLLEDGEIQRHVRRVRRIYHQRRDAFCAAVDQRLGSALSYARPAGGLALWARVAPDVDLGAWHARCQRRGVFFQVGALFTFDRRPIPFARLGYAALDERSLATAVRVLRDNLGRRPATLPVFRRSS
jgi:GntR family transcriptional regulator/MocR family aminotransferase